MGNVNVRFYNPHTHFEPVECSLPARPQVGDKVELPNRPPGVVAEITWRVMGPDRVWQAFVRLDRDRAWEDVIQPRVSTERG